MSQAVVRCGRAKPPVPRTVRLWRGSAELASALLALAFAASPAAAQSYLFGGYSALNADPDSEVDAGWTQGVHAQLLLMERGPWALVVDGSAHFGMADAPSESLGGEEVDVAQYTVLAGVRRTALECGRLRAAMRVLVGASTGSADTELTRSLQFEETTFAAVFGGLVTLDLSDRVALGLIQPNLLLTTFGGETQWTQRLSTGLVVKLGGG